MSRHNSGVQRTCRFFLEGNCSYGKNCRDFHPGVTQKYSSGRSTGTEGTLSSSPFGPTVGQLGFPAPNQSLGPMGGGGLFGFGGLGNNSGMLGTTRTSPFGGGQESPFGRNLSPFGAAGNSGNLPGGGGLFPGGNGRTEGFGIGGGNMPGGTQGMFGTTQNKQIDEMAVDYEAVTSTFRVKSDLEKQEELLQFLEMGDKGGMWPFSCGGTCEELSIFAGVDFSVDEYRWDFYQRPLEQWSAHQTQLKNTVDMARQTFRQQVMQMTQQQAPMGVVSSGVETNMPSVLSAFSQSSPAEVSTVSSSNKDSAGLTGEERAAAFRASRFEEGKIPEVTPEAQYCC